MGTLNLVISLTFIVIVYSIFKKKRVVFTLWIFVLVVLLFFIQQANDFKIVGILEDKLLLEDENYAKLSLKGNKTKYEMYDNENKLFDKGALLSAKFQSVYEGKISGTNKHTYIYSEILFLTIIIIIFYFGYYTKSDYYKIRDFIRNGSKVPVTYLKQKDKDKIIGGRNVCRKCNLIMKIDKEIYAKGMHMLHLTCKCGEETKIRINEKA